MANISLRIVALIAGLLMCYLAAFNYAKGRGRVRHKLEDWWIKLRREPEFAASPATAFIGTLAWDAEVLAARKLGFSFESIAYYICLSLMSCLLSILVLIVPAKLGMGWSNPVILLRIAADKDLRWIILGAISPWVVAFLLNLYWYGVSSFYSDVISAVRRTLGDLRCAQGRSKLLLSLRGAVPKFRFRIGLKSAVASFYGFLWVLMRSVMIIANAILFPIFLILCVGWLAFLAYTALHVLAGASGAEPPRGWAFLFPLLAAATSVLFLSTMRWTLQECRRWPFKKMMIALLALCVVASLLFWGPLWLVRERMLPTLKLAGNAARAMAVYLAFSNAVDVLAAYGLVVMALLLLAHRIVWPRLWRPVTALRLAGVSLHRSWLWGIGIVLLLSATGSLTAVLDEFTNNPDMLKQIEDFFKSFMP